MEQKHVRDATTAFNSCGIEEKFCKSDTMKLRKKHIG